MTHVYEGAAKGFKPTYVIDHVLDDTEGYIGYLPSNNSIYVVFRGSVDLRSFVTDLSIDKKKYKSFPECDCEVHSGFYDAEQAVLPGILSHLSFLKGVYPTAAIKTTGHSLGAALALLTGLDLIKAGYSVQMTNFGQPRVGNGKFSTFVKTKWPEHWRVVHHKDIVPHNPSSGILMEFWHTCYERYQDSTGMHACPDSSCEDPHCAAQWSPLVLNIDDHLSYLGMCMGVLCGGCGTSSTLDDTPLEDTPFL